MQSSKMYGVVLWSSDVEGRAVIWCEDHGNLAFYNAKRPCDRAGDLSDPALDPGDLIEFDLHDDEEHRRAHNPRLLVEDHSPQIADGLRRQSRSLDGGNVVSFPKRSAALTPAGSRRERA